MDEATFEEKRDELLDEFLHSFNAFAQETLGWRALRDFMTELEDLADPAKMSDEDVKNHLVEMRLVEYASADAEEKDDCGCC